MQTPRSTKRLVQLFERELRDFNEDASPVPEATTPKRRVSRDLELQVVKFAATERTSGKTPEQMLVELKDLLSTAAPDVPGSRRTAFVASVTSRAIDAFFGSDSSAKKKR
jgi:hypothetical protein